VKLPEPIVIDPQDPQVESLAADLHANSGIYLIRMHSAQPHLSSCAFLRARVRRLLSSRQRVIHALSAIECWPTASRLEAWLLLLALAQRLFPRDFEEKLRLRLPWFVSLSSDDRFPRLVTTHRLPGNQQHLYGPFATKDGAHAYEEAVSGLFQIRKCADPLIPSTDHPGCIYGEMNQCLRPCQLAVSGEEYVSETTRVAEFLSTNGTSTRTSLVLARERASEDMDFEMAAQIHKRLERLESAMGVREDLVTDASSLTGVALTHSLVPSSVRLWPMKNGIWLDPIDLNIPLQTGGTRSLDAVVRDALHPAFSADAPGEDPLPHMAILLRWYRSSWRDGEWFPSVRGKGISYRKLVGGISRLMRQHP
jgi:excinuclease ABC subunit C